MKPAPAQLRRLPSACSFGKRHDAPLLQKGKLCLPVPTRAARDRARRRAPIDEDLVIDLSQDDDRPPPKRRRPIPTDAPVIDLSQMDDD